MVGFTVGVPDCAADNCRWGRLGSALGSSVVVPVGPLNETACVAMLSMCQSPIIPPSDRTSGSPPDLAKIAMCRLGITKMPVSRRSFRDESGCSSDAVSGGRRVTLNSGRAKTVATSRLMAGLPSRTAVFSFDIVIAGRGAVMSATPGRNSTNKSAAKQKLPARQTAVKRSIIGLIRGPRETYSRAEPRDPI